MKLEIPNTILGTRKRTDVVFGILYGLRKPLVIEIIVLAKGCLNLISFVFCRPNKHKLYSVKTKLYITLLSQKFRVSTHGPVFTRARRDCETAVLF